MRRNISLAVLASVSALAVVGAMSPAAAEAVQDSYCLQGRQHGYPAIASFPATSSAWPLRAEPGRVAGSIR